jgi:rare lipoprotein A
LRALALASAVALALVACGGDQPAKKKTGGTPARSGVEYGIASWYGGKHHGGPTASGERFNKNAMTAAHRTLRMGTRVKVTRIKNGRTVIVRINDRGPYSKGRIIDLSEAAARDLDMLEDGIAKVKVEVLR